jgi:tight adherence protein C
MLLFLIYLFAIAGIALITVCLLESKKESPLRKIGVDARRIRKPFFLASLLKPFNRILITERLKQNLLKANSRILPQEFVMIKEFLAVIFPVALYLFSGGAIEPFWLILSAALGFLLPSLYLTQRIHKRKEEILKQLPDVLDMFLLTVNAGLDFMTALKWILEYSRPGPLIQEFRITWQEVNMGRPREEAFREMARRLDIFEVSSMVRTIIQGDKRGTPISEIIAILSEETRRQRFQRAERIALLAPIKILFPLVVFILPVVAIIIGGPIILQFMQTGLPHF